MPYEQLAEQPKLKGHATNVMYAFTAIVDNLNNNEVLVELLTKNGQSHAPRNIPPEAYDVCKNTTHKSSNKFHRGYSTTIFLDSTKSR